MCLKELDQPGGLFFLTPDEQERCSKHHFCHVCVSILTLIIIKCLLLNSNKDAENTDIRDIIKMSKIELLEELTKMLNVKFDEKSFSE